MPCRTLKIWLAAALTVIAASAFAATAPAAILYTNNYNSEQLASFTIGADGLLTAVPGSPFQFEDPTEGFSITPDGRIMVESFGFDSKAGSFALSPDGGITRAQAPIGPGGYGTPAISPNGQFAYILTAPGGTIAYRLGSDGSMTKIGGPFGTADGGIPALTPDGRFLFIPSYSGESIERFTVQSDGTLASLGATPIGTNGPDAIRITPDGRFAILLVDPSGIGYLRSFAIGTDGSLTEVGSPLEPRETSAARQSSHPTGSSSTRPTATRNRSRRTRSGRTAYWPKSVLPPLQAFPSRRASACRTMAAFSMWSLKAEKKSRHSRSAPTAP